MTAKKEKAQTRKKRVPLGVPRLKMAVGGREGYHRRWINDDAGRLSNAIEGGYNFVPREDAEFKDEDVNNQNASINNATCKTVNSDGKKAYLMEISNSFYESDQLAKAENIDKTEDGLRIGADVHGKPGTDGRYVPEEGIKIDT